MGHIIRFFLILSICSIKNDGACTGLSMSKCVGKGTIGGYTVTKETTMK